MNMTLKTISFALLTAFALSSCVNNTDDLAVQSPTRGSQNLVPNNPQSIQVSKKDAAKIGHKIWMNEGAAKVKNLTVWNKGETFASLGIGHFIWYPVGQEGPYDEQFPKLLTFLRRQRTQLPDWLKTTPDCPWNSRREFYNNIKSRRMVELRKLLKDTIPQQVAFIIVRLEKTLPKMMAALPTKEQRARVRKQFYRVAQQPQGVYALIDYVNFKGEGTDPKERYDNQGWGLLQVLENMPGTSKNVMAEFAKAADKVLRRRVRNAPRDERRWLRGWRKRLRTYTYEF